ncbi:uncharacterized protein BHQ10_007736 [Talaromyces amestolkiae]|uniref:RRM domain-containing protein n=1 Tax=Talaromyces amestolkiae TaxID=1196081 RepID=A0A364L7D9_TALAM|nr:uncharacterized protein BHQ10_007736 [Talaromyces amestolkiae]RAO71724.1 hypothetical protein BHQ10_007736 [Talaromyces amestolkiae]
MDRSLEEIISERPAKQQQQQQQQQNRRGRSSRNTSNAPRDGVKKLTFVPPFDVYSHIVTALILIGEFFPRRGVMLLLMICVAVKVIGFMIDSMITMETPVLHDVTTDLDAKETRRIAINPRLRIDNLHWDLTEEDLEGLFGNIGPVQRVRINFDRAGRSEGTATVTYQYLEDARQAIREFDGANAKGQPIRLTLLPGGGRGAGGSKAEKSKSLFDRIERPLADRTERSLSPDGEGATNGGRRRRGGRGGRAGRSDTSKPAPDHIDRYVPGQQQSQRSPTRRGQTGRRPGERRDDRRGGNRDVRRGANGGTGPRPKKTQEELDAEMDDYWGNTAAADGAEEKVVSAPATVAAGELAGAAPAGNDDDIDMIE